MTSPRLKRIQSMSRFLKGLILSYFVVIALLVFYGTALIHQGGPTPFPPAEDTFGGSPKEYLYYFLYYSLSLLGMAVFYRLLSLYEKGVIFSTANTLQIRRLGYLVLAYALLKACDSLFLPMHGVFNIFASSMNFLMSCWFFTGCFVVVVSWIMDEGCKIQEEQELTV